MLSLAGTVLLSPTAEVCTWIERHLPVRDAPPWVDPSAARPGPVVPAGFDAPYLPMPRELRINEFYWPATGAQRWAYGAFLASTDQVEEIRAAANGDDGQSTEPVSLSLDDGRGNPPVAVDMTLLRIVPLSAVKPLKGIAENPNNLFLLVVVDARYFWQRMPLPDFGIKPYGSYNPANNSPGSSTGSGSPGSTGSGSTGSGGDGEDDGDGGTDGPPSWEAIITATTEALGITLDLPEISSDYLYPDPGWNAPGVPAGPVLDALLANVGLRLVAKLDGTFEAQGWQLAQFNRASADGADDAPVPNAGGDQFLDAPADDDDPEDGGSSSGTE